MLSALAAGSLALSLLAQPAIVVRDTNAPPDGTVTIQIATVNGTGCPPGTATIAMDPGNSFMTITYSEFMAQVGVGAKPTDMRKNCQVSLGVHIPGGFTYAIAKSDYRGYASIQNGAWGIERANYYFQGMSQSQWISHTIAGPIVNNWQTTDNVPIAAMVFRPCGENRNFTINTELSVYGGNSNTQATTSWMTMDSHDVDFSTVYHFAWRRCP
jgi:hypothetical protein